MFVITGLSFKNFRGIEDRVELPHLPKVTILVGRNNAGKTSVLKALQWLQDWKPLKQPRDWECRNRDNTVPSELGFGLCAKEGTSLHRRMNGKTFWLFFETPAAAQGFHLSEETLSPLFDSALRSDVINALVSTQIRFGTPHEAKTFLTKQAANIVTRSIVPILPKVVVIPEHRKLGGTGDSSPYSGTGIRKRLQALERPTLDKSKDEQVFLRIQNSVGRILQDHTTNLRVSYNSAEIQCKTSNTKGHLPLAEFGTGIQQLVILMTTAVSQRGKIVCIEEPESNLHPTLQAELVRFLLDDDLTGNQYILTSHSPFILNSVTNGADISAVHLLPGRESVQLSADDERLDVLRDLGARPSDLLMTNFIIWVEGPSDRLLMKHWIGLIDDQLTENVHYSFMFTGGSILAYLDTSGDASADLIQALTINPNACIVFDSDKKTPTSATKKHVARLVEACAERETMTWVTAGREIENYVPSSTWTEIFGAAGNAEWENEFESIDSMLTRALGLAPNSKPYSGRRKTKLVEKALPYIGMAELSILDLKSRVSELVERIVHSNER